MTAKQKLLDQLSQNDFKGVLKGLESLGKRHSNTQILGEVTFQSGRLKALENRRNRNTISLEDDNLETAKIRQALLQTVNDLSDNWGVEELKSTPVSSFTNSKNKWKKYVVISVSTIVLLISIAAFTGLSDFLKTKKQLNNPQSPHRLLRK